MSAPVKRRPADTVLVAVADLVSQLHEAERRNDELDRRNADLTARLAEVEDCTSAVGSAPSRHLREAYRRGYQAGHGAGREGRPRRLDPENAARGVLAIEMGVRS